MKIFLNIQLFQNDQVQNNCQNIMKPRRQKVFCQATKGSLFFLSLWNLCLPFYRCDARVRRVLGLRTSSSCHWHPIARVCVCLLIMMENAIKNIFAGGALRSRAKLFAMSGGLPVGKRIVRQGLEPRAIRPKNIAPNGGQQEVHPDFPFFTLDELERPFMMAQPNLSDT